MENSGKVDNTETMLKQEPKEEMDRSNEEKRSNKIKQENEPNTKFKNVISIDAELYNPFEDVTETNGQDLAAAERRTAGRVKVEPNANGKGDNKTLRNSAGASNMKEGDNANDGFDHANKVKETNYEDDGEDLPDNFFDDFSNTDFMAGLDIVDDWIDDDDPERITELKSSPREVQELPERDVEEDDRKMDLFESDRPERLPHQRRASPHKYGRSSNFRGRGRGRYVERDFRYRRNRYSRERYSRDRYSRDRYSRGRYSRDRYARDRHSREDRYRRKSWDRDRSREYDRYRGDRRSPIRRRSRGYERPHRSPERGPDDSRPRPSKSDNASRLPEESTDCRRDPEKTRRDIHKDKLRCAKDQEARVFQEQLKVAETGLVPPGTELEVVLESEKLKKYKEQQRSRSRSRTPVSRRYSPRERERSTRDDLDLRSYLREKRRRRYVSDLSPVSDAKTSRSPMMSPWSSASNLSDRDTCLRNKDRRRGRYSRSCSPISSNSLSDDGYVKRKRTKRVPFQEEIERKLNASSANKSYAATSFTAVSNLVATTVPVPESVPLPVPVSVPPPVYQPSAPMPMQYSANPPMYMAPEICPPPYALQMPVSQENMCHFGAMPPAVSGASAPAEMAPTKELLVVKVLTEEPKSSRVYSNLKQCFTDGSSELNKLFEDKKISLSDYLSVSAKSLDSAPTLSVHNRIRVIARCQEAIKALSEDSKLAGRFFPKLLSEEAPDNPGEPDLPKWRSPLRKVPPIRIRSTIADKNKKNLEQPARALLYKLLCATGLENPVRTPNVRLRMDSAATVATTSVQTAASTSVQTADVELPKTPASKMCSVPTQTDSYKCQFCQKHSEVTFVEQGTQTADAATFEVSTQVSIEDLTKSCVTFTPRGILKSNASPVQSISHLTPAQLLAQADKPKKEEPMKVWKTETFTAARYPSGSTPRPLFQGQDMPLSSLPSNKEPPTNFKPMFDSAPFMNSGAGFGGKASFAPDRPFGRNSADLVQRNEFPNRPVCDQFNAGSPMKRGNRYLESSYQDEDFTSDSPFLDAIGQGNRTVGGRGRGAAARGTGNMFHNRPFFN